MSKLSEVTLLSETTGSGGAVYYRGTFEGCMELTTFKAPPKLIVGNRTFYGCEKLTEICLGREGYLGPVPSENVERAISGSGIKKIIGKSISLGAEEFPLKGIEVLPKIIRPLKNKKPTPVSTVYLLPDAYFKGCRALKGSYIIDCDILSPDAFYECKAIEAIYCDSAKIEIGSNCFYGCESLKAIYLPGVEYLTANVKDGAFKGCPSDLKIYISYDGRYETARLGSWGITADQIVKIKTSDFNKVYNDILKEATCGD
jgi:hypothetical protein